MSEHNLLVVGDLKPSDIVKTSLERKPEREAKKFRILKEKHGWQLRALKLCRLYCLNSTKK